MTKRQLAEENTVECCLPTVYALAIMPDVDFEDFRYGRLLTLATILALVIMVRSLLAIFT